MQWNVLEVKGSPPSVLSSSGGPCLEQLSANGHQFSCSGMT